jgi:DNA polymerase III alpha subunit
MMMEMDKFNRIILSENDVFNALMEDPLRNLDGSLVKSEIKNALSLEDFPNFYIAQEIHSSPEEFHNSNQQKWHMPIEYYSLDIAEHILNLCSTEQELQRVGAELMLFYENNALSLLSYLKYLSDTMKSNGIVGGVGRGSCTSSYVLYLIGIHRIDSLYYDLDVTDFFKENKNGNL